MLLTLACTFLACSQSLPTTPDDALLLAQASGDITVTYECGNTFLFRNRSLDTLTLTWRVRGNHEEGTVFLPARPASGGTSETRVTTKVQGPLQVFRGRQELVTVPNLHGPACDFPLDTVRPPVPNIRFVPVDSAHQLANPAAPAWIYLRRFALVRFSDTLSGAAVNSFIQRRGAIIRGGNPSNGEYLMEFPDPATTWDGYLAWLREIQSEPGLDWFMPWADRGTGNGIQGLFPVEGASFTRSAWFDRSSAATWALRAVRAPMAWGCQANVAGLGVRVGVLEWDIESNVDEVDPSIRATTRSMGPSLTGAGNEWKLAWHGMAVAGMVAATGGNGKGIVGTTWGADLYPYELNAALFDKPTAALYGFELDLLPALEANAPQVLTISSDLVFDAAFYQSLQATQTGPVDDALIRKLAVDLESAMQRNPRLLIIKAVGNEGQTLTSLDLEKFKPGATPLLIALNRLRLRSATLRDRIIFVGGTQDDGDDEVGNRWWSEGDGLGSNYIVGETDIAAPAGAVVLLGSARAGAPFSGDIVTSGGTSFAAPMVAGIAAQVLAMDPNLSPAEVKRVIVEGAANGDYSPMAPYWGRKKRSVRNVPGGGVVYQADAYATLRKVAEWSNAPLCGNRLWAVGNAVYAARDNGPELIGTVSDNVGEILPYHGGRKVLIQKGESARYAVYELQGAGVWDSTGLWDRDRTGLAGSGLSASGWFHDLDSLAFIGYDGNVQIGTSFGVNARSVGPTPQGTISATGETCVVEVKEDGNWNCDLRVFLRTTSVQLPNQYVTPVGDSTLLWPEEEISSETTVQSAWLDCASLQPATEFSICRFHDRTTTQTARRSSIWMMGRAATGHGVAVKVLDIPNDRLVSRVTASEDGASIAIATGVGPMPNSSLGDCQVQFYSYDAAGTLQPSGAPFAYGTICTNYNWQGGFGASRQQLTAAPEPTKDHFSLQTRLASVIPR